MKFVPKNPDFKAMILEKMKYNAFMHYIGFEPDLIEPGMVTGQISIKPHHLQQTGFLHGGVICTLSDLVSGWAAFTLVQPEQTVVTVEIKTNFLNPGIGQQAFAKGYVVKAGKMLTFTECEVYSSNQNEQILIAKSYATFATIQV